MSFPFEPDEDPENPMDMSFWKKILHAKFTCHFQEYSTLWNYVRIVWNFLKIFSVFKLTKLGGQYVSFILSPDKYFYQKSSFPRAY